MCSNNICMSQNVFKDVKNNKSNKDNRGLASADEKTRERVARAGGKASRKK